MHDGKKRPCNIYLSVPEIISSGVFVGPLNGRQKKPLRSLSIFFFYLRSFPSFQE